MEKIFMVKTGKFDFHCAKKVIVADEYVTVEAAEFNQKFYYKDFEDVILVEAHFHCSYGYIIFIDRTNKDNPNTRDDYFHRETLDKQHKIWFCVGGFSIKKTNIACNEVYEELKRRFIEFKEKQNAPKEEIVENASVNSSNDCSEGYSVADEIRKFKQLKDEGIITEEEFIQKKKELLGL